MEFKPNNNKPRVLDTEDRLGAARGWDGDGRNRWRGSKGLKKVIMIRSDKINR